MIGLMILLKSCTFWKFNTLALSRVNSSCDLGQIHRQRVKNSAQRANCYIDRNVPFPLIFHNQGLSAIAPSSIQICRRHNRMPFNAIAMPFQTASSSSSTAVTLSDPFPALLDYT